MTNGQEEAINSHIITTFVCLAQALHQVYALHAIITIEAYGIVFKEHLNLFVVQHALLHDLRGTQVGLADNQIDFRSQTSQIDCLFTGRITTAHYGYHLLAIEEAIASSTGTHTHSSIFLFILQTKVLSCCPRSNDHGVGRYHLLFVDSHLVGSLGTVEGRHDTVTHISTKAFSLLAQVLHQFGASNTLRITREILHLSCCGQLSSQLKSSIEYRV